MIEHKVCHNINTFNMEEKKLVSIFSIDAVCFKGIFSL